MPNDTQMDVLMRRFAKGARKATVRTEHLDADELNAFAEGSLPAATRANYVSHLADCDDCRTIASQLVVASGAPAIGEVPATESLAGASWWQRFNAFLSPPALRYAASALVLIAVVGVTYVVWRRNAQERNSALIARNEPEETKVTAQSSPASESASPVVTSQSAVREATANVQPTPSSNLDKKGYESPVLEAPAAPKPAKDATEAEAPTTLADRAMKAPRAEASPSYAPPPPGEYRVDTRQREQQAQVAQAQVQQQQNVGNVHGGPRRNETVERYRVLQGREGTADAAKARDEDRRTQANQPAATENKQEELPINGRQLGQLSTVGGPRKEAAKAAPSKSDRTEKSEPAEPISVGGRKFRRLGNVWVDVKFKSSMTVTTVNRGSDNFAELDSKLRSISQQLSGEVLVVWKGKAYRIR